MLKWIPIFEEEAMKRKLKLTKPNDIRFEKQLDERGRKKDYQRDVNKNFDNKFLWGIYTYLSATK